MSSMKYILTLEKFKSKILNKLNKIFKNSGVHKMVFHILLKKLKDYDIKISDIDDDHLEYYPVNKIIKGKNQYKVKSKFVKEDGTLIDELSIGDYLIEHDGDIRGQITSINFKTSYDFHIITKGTSINERNYKDFFRLPKKDADNLFFGEKDNGRGLKMELSYDQIWEGYKGGELVEDTLKSFVEENSDYINLEDFEEDYDFEDGKSSINYWTSTSTLMEQLNIKRLVSYYDTNYVYDDNDIILGFDYDNNFIYNSDKDSIVDHNKIKNECDYIIVLKYDKIENDLKGLGEEREKRSKSKEGSPHFKENLSELNRKELLSKLASKYHVSDVENLKKYTDFSKLLKKAFNKNPILTLRSIGDQLDSLIRKFNTALSEKSAGRGSEKTLYEINDLYSKIINHPFTLIDFELLPDNLKQMSLEEEKKQKLIELNKEINKLQNQIKSSISNYDYEDLDDLFIILNKIKGSNEFSKKRNKGFSRSFLSMIDYHRFDNIKMELSSMYKKTLSESLWISISGFIQSTDVEEIEDNIKMIKTLYKIWK